MELSRPLLPLKWKISRSAKVKAEPGEIRVFLFLFFIGMIFAGGLDWHDSCVRNRRKSLRSNNLRKTPALFDVSPYTVRVYDDSKRKRCAKRWKLASTVPNIKYKCSVCGIAQCVRICTVC